jgi:hypothetical protein
LIYTQSFFAYYGWINNNGSAINLSGFADWKNQRQAAESQVSSTGTTAALKDGSLAELLFATLHTIGGWDPNNIYIEKLPHDLIKKMTALAQQIDADNEEAKQEFNDLMTAIIGAGSYGNGGAGSGGVSTGQVKGADKIVPIMAQIANKYNIPPAFVVAVGLVETNLSGKDSVGNPHYGWFQMQTANPPYAYGRFSQRPPTLVETHDLGIATTGFCEAAQGWVKHDPSLSSNWQLWAERTQGITPGDTNNSRYTDPSQWNKFVQQAHQLVSQYTGNNAANDQPIGGGRPIDPNSTNPITITSSSRKNKSASAGQTVFDAIVAAANELDSKHYKYVFGGGHNAQFAPTNGGYDCSGSVSYVLHRAGLLSMPMTSTELMNFGAAGPGKVTIYANPDHTFMKIGDRFWGTSDGRGGTGKPWSPAWIDGDSPDAQSGRFTVRHVPGIDDTVDTSAVNGAGSTGSISSTDPLSIATAASFAATLELPSLLESVDAMALQGEKSLMNDVPLLPFIQQMCQASLREFQSMPNGDFFAFCPDYFGETFHRKPYWYIDDIEVLDGGITLSDDALVTHMYVVGDTTFTGNEQLNRLASAGTLTIFNVFMADGILNRENATGDKTNSILAQEPTAVVPEDSHGMNTIVSKDQAIQFLRRYGARPAVEDMPMIHNPYFEMFLAYQRFLLAWSRQFLSTFTFTFMPELFPGGKVGFPDHGLQMYIDEVTHSFDYTSGFTTQAGLSAPSVFTSDGKKPTTTALPPNMVEAMFEPVKKKK